MTATFTPRARVVITLAASGLELDVTDDLISLATNKCYGMAAGGWQIALPPRILPKQGKTYDELINTDDLVVIDIDGGDGLGFQRIMVGLVSRISRVSNWASGGLPQRFVKVTGQDLGKMLMKHDCGWDIARRPEVYGSYEVIRQGKGVFFSGTAAKILDAMFNVLFLDQVTRMAPYCQFSAKTDDQFEVFDWSILTTTGVIWNAMKQLANQPYNILTTDTRPDTSVTLFDVLLEKYPVGDDGKLTRPEQWVIDPEDVIASDIGRCDDERVTYEWLRSYLTILGIDNSLPIQSVIAGMVNYDKSGVDIATHGFCSHIIDTSFTYLQSSAEMEPPDVMAELVRRSTAFWERIRYNQDLHSGTFRLAISPRIRAGQVVLESSVNREYLVESVDHNMLFGDVPQYATTITVSRADAMTTQGAIPQSLMKTHPSVAEIGQFGFPLRGIIENVHFRDTAGNRAKQTVVDIALLDGYPPLSKVPLQTHYTTKSDGEEWTPEKGAYVIVQFIAGQWRLPVVTGFLPQPENDIHAAAGEAPRMHHKRNGIDVVYDKDGNRRIKVAASDFLDVVTDLTVTVIDGLTKFISKGKTLIKSQGTVEIDGIGAEAVAVKGIVQGDCICPLIRRPHIHVSASVKGSK